MTNYAACLVTITTVNTTSVHQYLSLPVFWIKPFLKSLKIEATLIFIPSEKQIHSEQGRMAVELRNFTHWLSLNQWFQSNHKNCQVNSDLKNPLQLPKCVDLYSIWLLYFSLIYILNRKWGEASSAGTNSNRMQEGISKACSQCPYCLYVCDIIKCVHKHFRCLAPVSILDYFICSFKYSNIAYQIFLLT